MSILGESGATLAPIPMIAAVSNADLPAPTSDERELLLRFLQSQREAVLRKAEALSEDQARWVPDGALIAIIGIINHLTHVEWRWIDGSYLRQAVSRSEEEFHVGRDTTLAQVTAAYRERARQTDETIRAAPGLDAPCEHRLVPGADLRWVLLHLIEETARHTGHADATRELLDGTRGL